MELITKPTKKTYAKYGWKYVVLMYRYPTLRRATFRAAPPAAKIGWRVGRIVAKRKARQQLLMVSGQAQAVRAQGAEVVGARARAVGDGIGQLAGAAQTGGQLVIVYGPLLAEVLGLVQTPKPRRRAPAFLAGIALGATAAYLLERKRRPEHR